VILTKKKKYKNEYSASDPLNLRKDKENIIEFVLLTHLMSLKEWKVTPVPVRKNA
jgi:hypothetical protein